MEVHIYSVKAKSQTGDIRVKYLMRTQKGQAKRKSARDLRNQQRATGPGERAAGAMCLSLRISCLIYRCV